MSATEPGAGDAFKQAYDARWEQMWGRGLQPGQQFDAAAPSPVLLHLAADGAFRDKAVIVPGCGRGYDLVAIANAGATRVLGVELSQTAVSAAQAYCSSQLGSPVTDGSAPVSVQQADFLLSTHLGTFQAGYDYTFFCAMHPTLRQPWAEAWARLLQPGGVLATLIFPVIPGADANHGPPYPVHPDLYHAVLDPHFTLLSCEAVPAERSHPGRGGKEMLGLWQRKP